jgi:hypothetical protein
VENCQFINLAKFSGYSDLEYAQCVTVPVAINNYATGVDVFWYIEPGDYSGQAFYPGITAQLTGNTLANVSRLAVINIVGNGTLAGNLNIQHNTDAMSSQNIGILIDTHYSGTVNCGSVTIQNNTFLAALPIVNSPIAASINPRSPYLFHLASLSIVNNSLVNFPESGNANVGAQWSVNTGQFGLYTNRRNVFGSVSRPYKGTPAPVPRKR